MLRFVPWNTCGDPILLSGQWHRKWDRVGRGDAGVTAFRNCSSAHRPRGSRGHYSRVDLLRMPACQARHSLPTMVPPWEPGWECLHIPLSWGEDSRKRERNGGKGLQDPWQWAEHWCAPLTSEEKAWIGTNLQTHPTLSTGVADIERCDVTGGSLDRPLLAIGRLNTVLEG